MPIINIKNPNKTKQETWPAPIPLASLPLEIKSYPTDALPSVIRNAICEYQNYGQQPAALIACSALASISLACQSQANVARDKLLTSPVSLFFLVIASSGERKSAADKTFSYAIKDWEYKARNKLSDKIYAAKSLHQAWRSQKAGLLSQIKRAGSDSSIDIACLKEEYLDLTSDEPIIPLMPMLFFEDATQEALAHHLANGWPSSSLWSDEGALVLNGSWHAF